MKLVSIREESFGPLILRLKTSRDGFLREVALPQTPPPQLFPEHLLSALFYLRTWNLPPPVSGKEAEFRKALERIPLGASLSYSALALEIASSPRGVASRCAANPYLLRIPCHRVVGKQSLGGYQCGGAWKAILLNFERHLAQERKEQLP